jgi:hypothetical protein
MSFKSRVTVGVVAVVLMFILSSYFSDIHQDAYAIITVCLAVVTVGAMIIVPSPR